MHSWQTMKPQSFELSRKTEINYYSHAFVIHNPLIFLADFTASKKREKELMEWKQHS